MPFPEAMRVLEQLRQDYRLALISNTQGQAGDEGHRLQEFPELARCFEVIVISGEDGIPAKPDPEPFRLCLQQLGVEADAAAYVGDDYRIDVCGARAAGIRPVWLKHHAVTRNWLTGDAEVPVITSLEPLLDLASVLRVDNSLARPSRAGA
jgi:FMN phosphatase YigB (HAD superfamily)